jgi:ribosomal protein S18 acetylase RimI-like enzyme
MTGKNHLNVRKFRATDLFAVKALIHRAIAACYPGYYCGEAIRFFGNYHNEQAIFHDAREGCTIVFERGGRIVGTGTLAGNEVKRVFVDPACQHEGVGRLIMEQLENLAAAAGVTLVKLDASLPSRSFYERLGYEVVERASLPVENGRRLDFFRMRKMMCVPTD